MILRHCTCIPVYNNPETIVSVMRACLEKSTLPLLIVDDGSDLPVQDLAVSLIEVYSERLFFLRLPKNLGKGVAIQKAFEWAIARSYTHLITLDGDGQHSADDIPRMLGKSEQNPWALIIGDRNMNTSNVPSSSIFGKKFSNFWIRYETEITVGDSQSGYRVYPLFHVQTMKFYTKRYDFEIEVLTRLIWKKVEVLNVPISVQYFPLEKRVSHFHKFKDNFLISITNAGLVFLSLLGRNHSPFKDSLALALGVFVGVFPIYGFHTLIVALFSFLLRLNFVYLWAGTQISIPPAVPLIFLFAGFIRTHFFGEDGAGFVSDTPSWLFSFFSLAFVASILTFSLFFLFSRSRLKKKIKVYSTIQQSKKDHPGIRIMNYVLRRFGLRWADFLLYFIVPFYFLFSFRAHSAANEYWKIIRPQMPFFSRQKKIFQQLFFFARQMLDRAYQNLFSESVFEFDSQFSVESFIRESRSTEKGLVYVSAHVGGWDFAATLFREHQKDKKIRAVMYRDADSYKLEAQSLNQNFQTMYFNQQSHGIIKLKMDLDRGQAIALMSDRPVSKNIELIPFFGRLALFDSTPFKVATMCGAKLCYIFCFKTGHNLFSVKAFLVDPMYERKLEDKERNLYRLMLGYVKELESALDQHPEQWYNFFPFWSHRVNLNN